MTVSSGRLADEEGTHSAAVHVVRVGLWEGDAVPHPSRPFDGLEDAADLGHEGQAVHYH